MNKCIGRLGFRLNCENHRIGGLNHATVGATFHTEISEETQQTNVAICRLYLFDKSRSVLSCRCQY